jgi:hypothetical protein
MEQASRLRNGGGRLVWCGLVWSGLVGMEQEGCDDSETMPQLSGSTAFPWSMSIALILSSTCTTRVEFLFFSSLGSTAFSEVGLDFWTLWMCWSPRLDPW